MFDTPSTVSTPGSAALTARMPSIVLIPASTNSDSPVASVKVSTSNISRPRGSRYSPQQIASIWRATNTLSSTVFAMPTDFSMVKATTAAPCSMASGNTSSIRLRPFSRFTEFTIARPGLVSSARLMTLASVLSIINGASTDSSRRLTTSAIDASSPSRSVSAMQTSSACAPPETCSRATSTNAS